MALLLLCVILGVFTLHTVKSSCFCNGLCEKMKPSCRYGEEIQQIVSNNNACYDHCEDFFNSPVQIASCFKGCLSDGCSKASHTQKWSKSIKEFFTFQKPAPRKMTESIFIVDNNQDSMVYALYINGQPVYAKTLHTKSNNSNHIVTYTFMSWTMFDRRSDMIMTTLAILCFLMGLILLLSPCFEEGDEDPGCAEQCKKKGGKLSIEHDKDINLALEEEMRKGLLEEFML